MIYIEIVDLLVDLLSKKVLLYLQSCVEFQIHLQGGRIEIHALALLSDMRSSP
jgi:hypothetical protein